MRSGGSGGAGAPVTRPRPRIGLVLGAAGRIAAGWLITIPAAAVVSGIAAFAVSAGFWGIVGVAIAAAAAILGIFLYSRRNKVDHRSFHQPEPGVFVAPKPRRAKKPKRAPKPLQVKAKQQRKKTSKKKGKK